MSLRRLGKAMMILSLISGQSLMVWGADRRFEEVRRFDAPEAHQGVAVDDQYFYAISTRSIGKYDKMTGRRIASWRAPEKSPFIHLDSGVVVDGKLYCAHSNYPAIPMTSSIEVWDTQTLRHIGTHSFGILGGSCTWIDRYQGYWWVVFAHYERFKPTLNKGKPWTTLVKFDDDWQIMASWVFPAEVLERFDAMSNSGGSWGSDSFLYCSGHDRPEVYVLKLPEAGSVLELVNILPISSAGQGLAWDRTDQRMIYTIIRGAKQVVVSTLRASE